MYHNHPSTTASVSRQDQIRGHFPTWQRSSFTDQLRKGGTIRQLQPNPLPPSIDDRNHKTDKSVTIMEEARESIANQEKVTILEKRLDFLRSQHKDTLSHLHRELDKLKTDNKDLNFKLVMCRCGINSSTTAKSREAQRSRQRQRKVTPISSTQESKANRGSSGEEQMRIMRDTLEKERRHNARLTRVVERMMQRSLGGSIEPGVPKGVILLNTGDTLSPDEYKGIIENLLLSKEQHGQEIAQLKKDFCDLLEDKPIPMNAQQKEHTPHGPEDKGHASRVVLPYITLREDGRKMHNRSHLSDVVRLPALKPHPPQLPAVPRHRKPVPSQRTRLGTFPR